jgi:hypothetical protein
MSSKFFTLPSSSLDAAGHTLRTDREEEFAVKIPGSKRKYLIIDQAFCDSCGAHLDWVLLNPKAKKSEYRLGVKKACLYPDPKPYQVKLAVPSGKIVFTDNLWQYGITDHSDDSDSPSYNTPYGKKLYAEARELEGIAYGAVLNTSPSVLLEEATGIIKVAGLDYNEEEDKFIIPAGHRKLGSISTDLWAYSFMDHDDFLAKGGEIDQDGWVQVADVTPGIYTFTHYADAPGFDHHAEGLVLFAEATCSKFEAQD